MLYRGTKLSNRPFTTVKIVVAVCLLGLLYACGYQVVRRETFLSISYDGELPAAVGGCNKRGYANDPR